jgi:hypothetical protein
MCFPYGLDIVIEQGDGNIVALHVTERAETAQELVTKGP